MYTLPTHVSTSFLPIERLKRLELLFHSHLNITVKSELPYHILTFHALQ